MQKRNDDTQDLYKIIFISFFIAILLVLFLLFSYFLFKILFINVITEWTV